MATILQKNAVMECAGRSRGEPCRLSASVRARGLRRRRRQRPDQPPRLRRALALTAAQSPASSHSFFTIHEPPTQGTLGRAR